MRRRGGPGAVSRPATFPPGAGLPYTKDSQNRTEASKRLMERRLATQYETVFALAESAPVPQTMPKILAAVGKSQGWLVGVSWVRDSDAGRLRASAAATL